MAQASAEQQGSTAGFPVIDVDSHFYEPELLWDRFVPAEYQSLARDAFWHGMDARGNRLTVLNGLPAKELGHSKIVRHAIWRPGSTPEDIGGLDPDVAHPINPGSSDPAARLADMDALGVDQAIVYPTLFAEYFPLIANPLAAEVLARAYNDWAASVAEASNGRIHPVAVLPLQSMLLAQRELDRVAEQGFKSVLLRPMFYAGDATVTDAPANDAFTGAGDHRGPFIESAHFRPLWRQLEELGLVACVHPSIASTNPEGTSLGTYIERVSRTWGIGHPVGEPVAYLQDNALFMIYATYLGLFEDFPQLKLAMAHGGATMVPLVLEKAETYLWLALSQQIGLSGEPVSLEPEEVLEDRQFLVSFDSWETPVARLPDTFSHMAGWGSRYPHHDAASADEALAMLEQHGVERSDVERLMGGNAVELFDLKVNAPA